MSLSWVDAASDFARHTKVIAVADVVESVRLMELDEQEFIRRWHGFVQFAKQQLAGASGRLRKSLGDGLMMEFGNAGGCIRAAVALQAWFNEGNEGVPPEERVHLRIGAHLAEFVADEHDIYGTDVNLTARIATLAGPGEIVVSAALRDQLQDDAELFLEDLGVCHLKHVRQPVRAFRVGRPGGEPVLSAAAAPARAFTRATLRVLPFVSAPGSEGLGDAVADEVVAGLARVPELQVISRFTRAGVPLARASFLLRGHVRGTGEALAVFAELSDAESAHVVWAHSFKAKKADLFVEDTELLRGMVAGIASGVMARESERSRGQPFPALSSPTLLLAAVAALHNLGAADLDRGEVMLEQLVDRNPRHPAAHAWLAHLHLLRLREGLAADRVEEASLARAHAHSALQADGHDPLALCIAGELKVWMHRDLDAAASRYAQALHGHQDDSLALLLQAEVLALRDEGIAAQRSAALALQLCPLAPLRYWYEQVAALAALVAGDMPRGLSLADRAVSRQPSFLAALYVLVAAQVATGRHEAARATMKRLLREHPGFTLARLQADCPACPAVLHRLQEALAAAGAPAG